ncbi:MAG: hypothetical protein HY517_03580 [Candidatus Aenigmarchaeota archaeon]|nr:hypothetical protein [Candidatus Aenigmarchaeota archaeon]
MERKELLVTVLIGVLLITTAMQTVALAGLSSGSAPVRVSSSAPSSSPAPSSSGSSSHSSLANLDSMVGGC